MRVVPLRFVLVQHDTTMMPIQSVVPIQQAVERANMVFRTAGIQFHVRSVEPFAMPNSYASIEADALVAGHNGAQGVVSWTQVQSELQQVFPTMPSNPWGGFSPRILGDYFTWAAYTYASPDAVIVYVAPAGTSASSGPWDTRHVWMAAGAFGPNQRFTHELGHYFGLGHLSNALMQPDPTTGVSTLASDWWDLVYLPGNPPTTFSSRAAALPYDSQLWAIDPDGATCGTSQPCVCTVSSQGMLSCPVSYNQTWTGTDPRMTAGMTTYVPPSGFGGGAYGINPMTYYDLTPGYDGPHAWSNSQARHIRKIQGFDVQHTFSWNVPSVVAAANGQRPALGQFAARRPAERLDFNGDGKRDFGIWEPPPPGSSVGVFRVALSNATNSNLVVWLGPTIGIVGDVPVPGDYDGDGLTDFALYRPGSQANGLAYPSDPSTWIWCPSTTYGPGKAHGWTDCTEALATKVTFGTRQDIPLVGFDMDASSATGELGTYRPSTNTFSQRRAPPCGSCLTSSYALGTSTNAVPLPGLYDDDRKTDLVVFEPGSRTYKTRMSGGLWSSSSTWTVDPGADSVPVGNMYYLRSTATPPIARLGLVAYNSHSQYWPYNAGWAVQWDAVAGTSTACSTASYPGDVPVGGLGMNLNQTSGTGYSTLSLFDRGGGSPGSGATGYLLQAPGTCSGTQWSVNQGATPDSWPVSAVSDMTGDGVPDVVQIEPTRNGVYVYTSESGYFSSFFIAGLGDAFSVVL